MAEPDVDPITGTAKVLMEVMAGLLPGDPMPEYSRRFVITSAEWAHHQHGAGTTPSEVAADDYANELRHGGLNWVQTTWIYL